jgi:hypothetical protein
VDADDTGEGGDEAPEGRGGAGGVRAGSGGAGDGEGGSDGEGTGGASGRGAGGAGGAARSDASVGADAAVTVDAIAGGAESCTLTVSVTTVTANGQYAPRNVGAVWIANSTGGFVKTLAEWGSRRVSHLVKWNATTSAAGLSRNTVDAITGSTARTHVGHMGTWDCTDTRAAPMRTGIYQLCMEVTESNPPPTQYGCVRFTHGGQAWKVTPANMTGFKGISLDYQPR